MNEQTPKAPRLNVRVMPKSKEELADVDGMVELVLAKLNQHNPETGMPYASAQQRKLFIADVYSVPPDGRVEKLREWVHIIPAWEMGKITQPAAQGSGKAVAAKRKRKRIRKPGAAAAEAQDRGAVQGAAAKDDEGDEG